MLPNTVFNPINIPKAQQLISSVSSTDLLAFTLTNGDILLGELHQHGKWNKESINIAFNMSDGRRYGQSRIIEVPITCISSIKIIPLNEDCAPRIQSNDPEAEFLREFGFDIEGSIKLPAHNYPNPLASTIYEHNMPIAEANNFKALYLIEESLSQDGIPTEGIHFYDDFLMYVDWEFFQTQSKDGTSIAIAPLPGLVQFEKSGRLSPEEQVLHRLKASLTGKLTQMIPSSSTGIYSLLSAILLVPDPAQDEEIEGEKCYLYQIANSTNGDLLPILIKSKMLKYPRGFLNRVSSKLVFYGEILQIPVAILGNQHDSVLLVRAIAYLSSK
jgi:hypothetical protein